VTLVLALDTATPQVSAAIGEDGRVLGSVHVHARRRHAETLVPAVAWLCDQTGVPLDRLDAIGVGTGPGLFTGLRVGVTTAKTMAQALDRPVAAVPSLDLVAHPLAFTERRVVAVLDARRREVFHAQYRAVGGETRRLTDYRVGTADDLVAELAADGEPVVLAGDGVAPYRAAFDRLPGAVAAGDEFAAPSVAALVDLTTARAERGDVASADEVTPLYVRASDAELTWDAHRR